MNPDTHETTAPIYWKKPSAYFFGILVCIFSLNGLLKKIADSWIDSIISQVLLFLSEIPQIIYAVIPGGEYLFFEILVRWVILSISLFFFLLLLNSFKLKSLAVLTSGTGGLLLGSFIFTWVSIILFVAIYIFAIIGWILYLLSALFSLIISFIFWSPVFYGLLGLTLIIAIGSLIYNIESLWEKLLEFLESISFFESLLKKAFLGTLILGFIIGIIYVLQKIWVFYLQPLLEIIKKWLEIYIAPIIIWIFWILSLILLGLFLVAGILLSTVILGSQYLEQFYSAKNCGKDTHKAFDAGFGLGVIIALVLLICSSNLEYMALVDSAWSNTVPIASENFTEYFHFFMPHQAEILLQSLFVKAALPIFDVTSLIIFCFLANCSLVMSLTVGTTEKPLREIFEREQIPILLYLLFGAVVTISTSIVGSLTQED